MNDAALMRVFQRLGDLFRNGQRFVEWSWTLLDTLRQRGSFDQLHHQRADAARFFQAMDASDVRMIQGSQNLGFAFEARHPVDRWRTLRATLSLQLPASTWNRWRG